MRSKLALGSLFLLFLFFTCNHFFSIFPFFFLISFPIFSFLFLSFIFHYINQLPYQYAWIYQAFITDDTIFSIAPATTSHYPLSLVLLFFFSLSLSLLLSISLPPLPATWSSHGYLPYPLRVTMHYILLPLPMHLSLLRVFQIWGKFGSFWFWENKGYA